MSVSILALARLTFLQRRASVHVVIELNSPCRVFCLLIWEAIQVGIYGTVAALIHDPLWEDVMLT